MQAVTQVNFKQSVRTLEQAKHDIETPSLELEYQIRLASKRIKRCKQAQRLVNQRLAKKQLEVND